MKPSKNLDLDGDWRAVGHVRRNPRVPLGGPLEPHPRDESEVRLEIWEGQVGGQLVALGAGGELVLVLRGSKAARVPEHWEQMLTWMFRRRRDGRVTLRDVREELRLIDRARSRYRRACGV